VPVIAIDPIGGGAKIKRQAETIGWPVVFTADNLNFQKLKSAFDYCLTENAKYKTIQCKERAVEKVKIGREQFISKIIRHEDK